VSLKLLRAVLQISGIEFIVLGFLSWVAEVWVQSRRAPDEVTLEFLVALADLSRALTHTPPYIALTILGILLIALGTALRRIDANGHSSPAEGRAPLRYR
jgi:hypothetical protein